MKKLVVVPLLVLLLTLTGCSAVVAGPKTDRPDPTPLTPAAVDSFPAESKLSPTAPVATAPESLDDELAGIIDEAEDFRVSVALADVTGTEVRLFGDDSDFFAASTAKVLTAAAFYTLVEDGEASLDQEVGSYDAGQQLEAMINQSDNESWLLLMQEVGYDELTDYAASLGVEYAPEDNLLTAADLAQILRLLQTGDLLDAEHTAQLLEFMQDTNNEDLIPAELNEDTTAQHKYGQIDGFLHDAALLSHHDSTVALVVFTENTGNGTGAAQVELIRALTRTVADAVFPDAA